MRYYGDRKFDDVVWAWNTTMSPEMRRIFQMAFIEGTEGEEAAQHYTRPIKVLMRRPTDAEDEKARQWILYRNSIPFTEFTEVNREE